jgi:hypothetical protein
MHWLLETVKVFSDVSASSADHTLNLFVLAELLDHKRCLHGELACWHEYKSLNLVHLWVDLLDEGDGVGCSFAGAVFRFGDDVCSIEDLRNGFFLDRGRELKAHFVDALATISKFALTNIRSSDNLKSLNSRPLRAVTSSVLIRVSTLGCLRTISLIGLVPSAVGFFASICNNEL